MCPGADEGRFQDAAISTVYEPPMNILRSIGSIESDDDYENDEYFEVAGLGVDDNDNDL